ncbi:hypothetical protein B0H10DRAFT_1952200 [Mycena sp. CBHHK59/15]|nr:hypothetical protein B0H10DRAFT_1952200 [Mycena sp. CBHHK59/15]
MSTRYARRLANTDQARVVPSHESGGARLGGRHLAVLVRVKHVQTPKSVEAVWVIESATRGLGDRVESGKLALLSWLRCFAEVMYHITSLTSGVDVSLHCGALRLLMYHPPRRWCSQHLPSCGTATMVAGVRVRREGEVREGGKGGAEQGGFSQADAL